MEGICPVQVVVLLREARPSYRVSLRASGNSGFAMAVPFKQRYFCAVYNHAGKVGLNFARVTGIQEENKGCSHAFSRENRALIWEKVPFGSLYFNTC